MTLQRATAMLRPRKADQEDRQRLPRWVVWLPVALLSLVTTAAVLPFLLMVTIPLGSSRTLTVHADLAPAAARFPIGIFELFNGPGSEVAPDRCWIWHVAGPIYYSLDLRRIAGRSPSPRD
jgi:hypothetical protein